jgi:hypothetical protein
MWSRAARFANAYAFFAIDVVYALMWIISAIAVGVWNGKGIREGAKEQKKDESCDTFKFGSASKCGLSKAVVGLAVVVLYVPFPSALSSISQTRHFNPQNPPEYSIQPVTITSD